MFAALLACAVFVAGCGGGGDGDGSRSRGEVSGVVYDTDSNPVRNARVYIDGGPETKTNSVGGYVLENVAEADVAVRAEVVKDNVRYFGSNVARTFGGERLKSHNITIFPDSQRATLVGIVRDSRGLFVAGARVFARQADSEGVLSSNYAITDGNGEYRLGNLRGGITYTVVANALGYDTSGRNVTLTNGEQRSFDFTLYGTSDTNLAAPQNLSATAYTAPTEATRSRQLDGAYEAVKRVLDPSRATRKVATATRVTSGGNEIEVDLTWDALPAQSLLGYGIYRGRNGQQPVGIDFLRDPLAEIYSDIDPDLVEGATYDYQIAGLGTDYDDQSGAGIGRLSDVASVQPLGDLTLREPSANRNPTFRWNAASGARDYTVLVYAKYPSINEAYLNAEVTYTTDTSWTWNGSPLQSGRTYYYIVIGRSANGDFSFSPVGSLQVN
jgi:hypothetical protein